MYGMLMQTLRSCTACVVNPLHSLFASNCATQPWLDSTIDTVDGREAIERSLYIVHWEQVSLRAASVTLHIHQRPALTAAAAGKLYTQLVEATGMVEAPRPQFVSRVLT
jgi:hypothetical protein